MACIKVCIDTSDAIQNLEALKQKILEVGQSGNLLSDQLNKVFNLQANKLQAQSVGANSQEPTDSDDVKNMKKQMTALTSSYVADMSGQMLKNMQELERGGWGKVALGNYQNLQWDEIYKNQIDSRIGLENNFTDFLRDKLAQQYGLYKSNSGQELDEWTDYYNSIKKMSDSWGTDINKGLSAYIFDALKGNGVKAQQDWRDMLTQMRKDFIGSAVDMAQDWAKARIFKPIIGAPDMPSGGIKRTLPDYADEVPIHVNNRATPPDYLQNGILQKGGAEALLPVIHSDGVSGFFGGTTYGPQIASALMSNIQGGGGDGLSSFLTGSAFSSSSISLTPFSAFQPMSSGGQADQASDIPNLSDAQQGEVSYYMDQGMSYPMAAWYVTNGLSGGSAATGSVAVSQAGPAKTGGGSVTDLVKAATSSNNGSWIDSLNQWGANNLGIDAGPFANVAPGDTIIQTASGQQVSVPSWDVSQTLADNQGSSIVGATPASTGLGTDIAGALGGLGTGLSAAAFIYPNGTGTVGGAVGGVLGGLGATMGLAGTSLGAALGSFAGPIGGLIGGTIGSLLTGGATTTTTPTGQTGNTILDVEGLTGYSPTVGWEGFKQTTSGMFGSGSTSHFTDPTPADPALALAA